jgi:hypothetical protein
VTSEASEVQRHRVDSKSLCEEWTQLLWQLIIKAQLIMQQQWTVHSSQPACWYAWPASNHRPCAGQREITTRYMPVSPRLAAELARIRVG